MKRRDSLIVFKAQAPAMVFVLVAVTCVGSARIATAQGATVAAGYSNAFVQHEFDWKNYQGFWVGASTSVRPQVAIVAEVDRIS